jgi:putative transferase (TIGR04331 family)
LFLITTADERTWKTNKKIIFLGEWCKLYSQKHIWSKLDYETIPYHWDNRSKYYQDYKYLSNIHEKYLKVLTHSLNNIHGYNYSIRYWRIVIGPWLRYFTDTVFDRYCSIKSAIDIKKVSSTHVIEFDIEEWIPKDFNQFYKNFTTDQWNHIIYAEIIKCIDGIPFSLIPENNNPLFQLKDEGGSTILSGLKSIINNYYIKFVPDKFNKIVFISSYFSDIKNLVKLQLSLGQIPYFYGPRLEILDEKVNWELRDQLKTDVKLNEFEKILNELIPKLLPKVYLEGFKKIKLLVDNSFPKNIDKIYTANAYSHDDAFKIWASGQVEKDVKLFIGNHGGNFSTARWSQSEDHQIAISDKYYSWGSRKKNYGNVIPLSAGKLLQLKNRFSSKASGQVLSVLASLPRYFYSSCSMPTAGQFLDYVNYQVDLTKLLEPELLKIYRMRFDSTDFDWDLRSRFIDNGLEDNVEANKIKLFDRLNDCRLCVATHNATVFLETFAANYPTVLVWDPNYYEIRESAKPYFNELHRVGILHYTPESASALLNKIYKNPLKWWMQEEIQIAKDQFCEKYAYVSDNWLEEWRAELLNNDPERYGDGKYLN